MATVNSNWREFGNPLQPINIKSDAANAYWSMGSAFRCSFPNYLSLLGDVALAESLLCWRRLSSWFTSLQKIWPEQVQPHFVAAGFPGWIDPVSDYKHLALCNDDHAFFSVLWPLLISNQYLSLPWIGLCNGIYCFRLHHWQNFLPILSCPFCFGMLVLRQWRKFFALWIRCVSCGCVLEIVASFFRWSTGMELS